MLLSNIFFYYLDLEYSVETVKSIENADESLGNIQELLKNAIFLKQQLKYEETRRKKDATQKEKNPFHRFSANIPDIESFSGVTNRIENIMGINSGTSSQAQAELQRSHTTMH